MELKPGTYKLMFDGADFILKRGGRTFARGDFQELLAMTVANPAAQKNVKARRRLAEFQRKSAALSTAEARLRRFAFDSKLTEHEAAQRP